MVRSYGVWLLRVDSGCDLLFTTLLLLASNSMGNAIFSDIYEAGPPGPEGTSWRRFAPIGVSSQPQKRRWVAKAIFIEWSLVLCGWLDMVGTSLGTEGKPAVPVMGQAATGASWQALGVFGTHNAPVGTFIRACPRPAVSRYAVGLAGRGSCSRMVARQPSDRQARGPVPGVGPSARGCQEARHTRHRLVFSVIGQAGSLPTICTSSQ
jgi:hypothetical protein